MAQVSQTIHGVTIKCITFPQRFIKEALHAGGFDIHDNEVIRIKQKGNVIVWLHTKTKARKARDCFYGLVIEGHKKLFADFYKDGSAPCPPRDIGVQNVSMKRVQEKIRELVMDHDAARVRSRDYMDLLAVLMFPGSNKGGKSSKGGKCFDNPTSESTKRGG